LLRRSSLQLRVGLFVPAFFILFSGFCNCPSPKNKIKKSFTAIPHAGQSILKCPIPQKMGKPTCVKKPTKNQQKIEQKPNKSTNEPKLL
jgi:hypothetical protein